MTLHKKTHLHTGFTFLELMVAIAIAAIVVTLAFRFLQDTSRGIQMQEKRIGNTEKMIIARKQIESVMNKIGVVVNVTGNEIDYSELSSDSVHQVIFRGDSLAVDNRLISNGIRKVNFEFDTTKREKVLYWECEMVNGGWTGGAVCP